MIDSLFWLGLSIFFVAISLTAVLIAAIPALQELARAARSFEKLCDLLSREFPPTLEAIRLTGIELTELSQEVQTGVENANQAIEQVNTGFNGAKKQVQQVQVNSKVLLAGVKAAWQTWQNPETKSES